MCPGAKLGASHPPPGSLPFNIPGANSLALCESPSEPFLMPGANVEAPCVELAADASWTLIVVANIIAAKITNMANV